MEPLLDMSDLLSLVVFILKLDFRVICLPCLVTKRLYLLDKKEEQVFKLRVSLISGLKAGFFSLLLRTCSHLVGFPDWLVHWAGYQDHTNCLAFLAFYIARIIDPLQFFFLSPNLSLGTLIMVEKPLGKCFIT